MFPECWILRWRVLYGHAGVYHNQRPLHVGDATVRWLPGHQHPSLAQVDAVPQHGPLRLPEHADRRVQRRPGHTVSKLYFVVVAYGFL